MSAASGVKLVGEQVTVSGMSDLAVGHGRFRLENPGPDPVRSSVDSAWLDVGGDRRPLTPATVFDEGSEQALEPDGFEVPPGTMTFLLGFPAVPDPNGPGESTSVGLRLLVDGSSVEAESPVVLQRRIPRR